MNFESFESFGKVFTGFDMFDDTIVVNEELKLPYHGFYLCLDNMELPHINVENLKNRINIILSCLEGVRGKYNEKKFKWELEWGTKPIELNYNDDYILLQIIRNKKKNALFAASKAAKKFPHNLQHNDIDNNYLEIEYNKKWCKFEIMLSCYRDEKKIIIEYNKLTGDYMSFYYLMDAIKLFFESDETKNWINRETNWMNRKDYLMFLETAYNTTNHITKILCDDFRAREICCYL